MFRDMLVEYDKQVARVEGQDIFLLLGGTGVGKSTTMHFLCGSTMKMSKHQTKDGALDHITFDKLNPSLDEKEKEMLT